MGLYKRAGILVRFFGFLIFTIWGLNTFSTPYAFAQENKSGSASIKAPSNLKKSAANKSDTTNKSESEDKSASADKSEEKKDNDNDKDKQDEKTKSADNTKKDDKDEENTSNATNNGTPFGAWLPGDRVNWEHPNSNNSGNIKQKSKTDKTKVKPVVKSKVPNVKNVTKVSDVKTSNAGSKNNASTISARTNKTSNKTSKNSNAVSRKSSKSNSGKLVNPTINTKQQEDLIAQEEPIDSSIAESEGGNLPNDTSSENSNNVDQPENKQEASNDTSKLNSTTIEPDSSQAVEGTINAQPSSELDVGKTSNTDNLAEGKSDSEPGIDESTMLEEEENTDSSNKSSIKNETGDVIKAIGVLCMVLAVIGFIWLLTKWIMGFREAPGFTQKTKLLHQMDLGMNQKLKLIQSGNMVLVLGVSPTGVQLFDKFPLDELESHDWSAAVTSKTNTMTEDIHFAPSEAPRKPRVTAKPQHLDNTPTIQTPNRAVSNAYSEAASASKGKSFTFRGGRLIERNEITDHNIAQSPAQEKLISQIRSKVKQWDL